MNREEAKQLLPVIEAFSKGREVEYYDEDLKQWFEISYPAFTGNVKYKVKPEPKYRPFNSKEECWNEMLKHSPFGWITDGDSNYNILLIDNSIVMVGDYDEYTFSRNYEHSLEAFKFIDGQPFGIKEEL